jgi:hypothetical protein
MNWIERSASEISHGEHDLTAASRVLARGTEVYERELLDLRERS